MINKEEFISLYRKYLAGVATPEECRLLNSYQDDLDLIEFDELDLLVDKQELRNRLWLRLLKSRNMTERPVRKISWISIAAACLLILSTALWYLTDHTQKADRVKLSAKIGSLKIKPGSNIAYLTMANGNIIRLSNAKNGQLATQAGIKISKAKNGMIVYQVAQAGSTTSKADIYNTITTPRGGQYQIILGDGTRVWLNAESSLKYPVVFSGSSRQVELTGEGYFEVAKNVNKPFQVHARGTVVQVLGTHFNINSYQDNKAVVATLLEGSIRMQNGKATTLLTPGQQGSASNDANTIKVEKADLKEVMGWKNGFFVFHDEDIATVMKQVSRWYDVDVEYLEDVKDREFGGTVSRYKDVTELLNNMEVTEAIHYKIVGRRVLIMR